MPKEIKAGSGIKKRKITYYVQRYRPSYEAISKEAALLISHFSQTDKVRIHDLHLDGIFKFNFGKKTLSCHFLFYPFLALFTGLRSRSQHINHIYTSLGDLPYLNVISLKKAVLTAAASCSFSQVKRRSSRLKKLRSIVVESEGQKKQLVSLGINESRIKLIYPPVDLKKYSYLPAKGKFKILYASCPTRKKDFVKRGINLILDYARNNEEEFILLWRKKSYQEIREMIGKRQLKNVAARNELIQDMNGAYAEAHCTIIPYTKYDDYLKQIPNSALESLAAGKPILVSSKTELAKIVQKEGCGEVFAPDVESLALAIKKLQSNYQQYQQKCRRVAEKYFSKNDFLRKYEQIYSELQEKEKEENEDD